jgi:hypothetical protein
VQSQSIIFLGNGAGDGRPSGRTVHLLVRRIMVCPFFTQPEFDPTHYDPEYGKSPDNRLAQKDPDRQSDDAGNYTVGQHSPMEGITGFGSWRWGVLFV